MKSSAWKNIRSFLGHAGTILLVVWCLNCAPTLHDLDETYVSEPYVTQRSFSFIQDGRTTREDISSALGEPTENFENGKILSFRLILLASDQDSTLEEYRKHFGLNGAGADDNPDGAYNETITDHNARRKVMSESGTLFVVRKNTKDQKFFQLVSREAEYSLVVLFDERNILINHTLLRVKP